MSLQRSPSPSTADSLPREVRAILRLLTLCGRRRTMKEVSVTQQALSHVPTASQNKRKSDYIGRDLVCKILEGDPAGAGNQIKIRIFNKRLLEDSSSGEKSSQMESKKLRLMPFNCSTPCPAEKHSYADSGCFTGSSASLNETEPNTLPRNLEVLYEASKKVTVDNELDDSLLEPSDNEADSPCHLTEEEISVLLDDNLPTAGLEKRKGEVYSREHSYWHDRNPAQESSGSKLSPSRSIVSQSGSESAGEWAESVSLRSHSSATGHRDTEEGRELERERDLVLEGDVKCSPVVHLPFDFDIDELLALSPIDGSSLDNEKEDLVLNELSVPQESKLLRGDDCVVNEPKSQANCEAICSTKPNMEQSMPLPASADEQPSSLTTVAKEASPKVKNLDVAKNTAPSQKSFLSPVVPSCIVDPQPSSGQNISSKEKLASFLLRLKKTLNVPAQVISSPASTTTGSKNMEPKNTVLAERTLTNTLNTAPTPAAQKGNQVVLSKDSKQATPPVKKLGKVLPVPKVERRLETIPPAELEQKKQTYLQCVFKHVKSPQDPNQDAYNELLSLMDQVASVEYRNQERSWQHPSDLTTRNYPRFSKKAPNKYSLKQWVSQNGGYHRRFNQLADRFERSPVVLFSAL